MKQILILLLISLISCSKHRQEGPKKTFLVETTLSKEELLAVISSAKPGKLEEEIVGEEPDASELQTQAQVQAAQQPSVVEVEKNAETTALIQKYKNVPKKASLFDYVVAFLIVVILLNLYFYGSQRKRLMKANSKTKSSINDYFLLDNHVC